MSFFFGTTHPNWPETFGNSPRARSLGELPNVSGTFPGLIADSFQHDLSGVFSGVVKPFTKSMHTDKTDISWGFSMNFGNNERHNNISPVIGVYAWRRQA